MFDSLSNRAVQLISPVWWVISIIRNAVAESCQDRQKPVFLCQHCGRTYRSKAAWLPPAHRAPRHRPVCTLGEITQPRYTSYCYLTLCGKTSRPVSCYWSVINPDASERLLYLQTFSSQLRTGNRKTVKMRRMCWRTKKRRRRRMRKRKNLCK